MKRLLAALAALCLLASSVSAKGLVIVASNNGGNNANFINGLRPLENIWLSTLRGLGANFDVIRADDLNGQNAAFDAQVDDYLRHGKIWRGAGMGRVTASGDSMVASYNPIIHLGFSVSDANLAAGATSTTKYRPDSLTLLAFYPTVTHLFVANSNHTTGCLSTVARCSTGVSGTPNYSAEFDSTMNMYEVGNPGRTWKSAIRYTCVSTANRAKLRGWRPILGSVGTRRREAGAVTNNYDYPDPVTGAANGCAYSSNPDTVGGLWAIMNVDSSTQRNATTGVVESTMRPIGGNAKPMLFCSSTIGISGTNYNYDMGVILTAIALTDSMSDGALLGGSTKLPAKVGIHIDDGWKRGDSNRGSGGGGIAWTDTTALKATIDSLATLGVPMVLGVECDSIVDYANYDLRWWSRFPALRFTPHCHAGISGTTYRTSPNLSTKFLNTIDLWGINLNRVAFGSVDSTLAYGLPDYTNASGDEAATYWLSKRAFALCDSIAPGRVDHLVMPPADDWTNARITHAMSSTTGNPVDSLFAAAALSGATAFRSNALSANSAVIHNATGNTGYGYYINQQPGMVRGSGSPAWVPVTRYGQPCNVLSCPGYQNTTNSVDLTKGVGSARSWSSAVLGQVGYYNITLRGLFGGPYDEAQWTGSATTGQNIRVSIQALHVGDLGSRRPATGAEDTRPGFYNLKYLVNSVKLANAHARQPLVLFAYPDEMQP